MKKILAILALGFTLASTACADNDVITRDVKKLPVKAQEILTKQFPKATIQYIEIDKDLFEHTNYIVKIKEGIDITFDSKGNWIEVDGNKKMTVPAFFIPETIKTQVADLFPEATITKIDKEARHYDVELSNDVDLTFDKKGKLKGLD